MKNMKKCFSILLALVMVFALAATAMAADGDSTEGETPTTPTVQLSEAIEASQKGTATITAPDDDHKYYIYQIFAGDMATDANNQSVLSNVVWGINCASGYTAGDDVDESVLTAIKAVSGTDKAKAEAIKAYVNTEGNPVAVITKNGTANVPTGYYMIVDKGPAGDKEEISINMVKLINDLKIVPKAGTTTSEKKVDDKNDSDNKEDAEDWKDSADYDIGDDVPFKLTATITDRYADYTKYQLTFHDKEDAGLTFDSSSVVVKVDGTTITTGYQVITDKSALTDGDTFEVKFADLKNISEVHAGSTITVEYKSKLNNNAVIGSDGNKNTMHITYSNNPYNTEGGEEGETPDDTVIVFTYKTVISKVDQDGKSLDGAAFKLEKLIKAPKAADGEEQQKDTWKTVKEYTIKDDGEIHEFSFTGLDDGVYRLTETVTPDGYNSIDPITFTITATHNDGDSPSFGSLSGKEDLPADAKEGTIPLTFTVDATDNNALDATVKNQAGSTLPETGGMGTTILYIAGGVLVAAAAVMLIVKRRMAMEK